MFPYRRIETIREAEIGFWIYRFHDAPEGVWVKRTSATRPNWTQPLLVQIFDRSANSFRPAISADGNVLFMNIHDAEQAVWESTLQYQNDGEVPL